MYNINLMTYNPSVFARNRYDTCEYAQTINQSTSPYTYATFNGRYENPSRCIYSKFPRPFDAHYVDRDSELKLIGRSLSKCSSNNYPFTNGKCDVCMSTFNNDKKSVVFDTSICPIVKNNQYRGGSMVPNPQGLVCNGSKAN